MGLFDSITDGLGGILSFGADLFGIETNRKNVRATNASNEAQTRSTNQANIDLANLNNDANAANVRATNEANALINADQLAFGRENMQMQRDFAQHGVRWKVADAKAAGLHPLAALGANVSSPSPVSVGSIPAQSAHAQAPYLQRPPGRQPNLPGQNISRAARSMITALERIGVLKASEGVTRDKLTNESIRLDNALKARELQNSPNMPAHGPSGIIDGQTGVNHVPAEVVLSSGLGTETGVSPMNKITVDDHGRISFVLGKAAEEALENDYFEQIKYFGRKAGDHLQSASSMFRNPGDKYQRRIANTRSMLAEQLGLTSNYIRHNPLTHTYYVTDAGMKKLRR